MRKTETIWRNLKSPKIFSRIQSEHLVRDQGGAGSNPLSPANSEKRSTAQNRTAVQPTVIPNAGALCRSEESSVVSCIMFDNDTRPLRYFANELGRSACQDLHETPH